MSTFRLDRLLLRKPMDPTCARSLFVGKQLIQVTFTVLLKLGLPDFVVTIFCPSFLPQFVTQPKKMGNGQIFHPIFV